MAAPALDTAVSTGLDTDTAFAEIVDALTRRGLLTGAAAGAAGLALAGCGSGSDSDSDSAASAPASRSVSTVHGSVRVPADPKRIVAAGFVEGCTLLDLGITPVGRTTYMPAFPAYTKALAGVPAVDDSAGKPVIEKIAALEPDLIVTADWAKASQQQVPYDELAAIAPTAVFTWEQAAGNWRDQAASTADAVGRTAALARLRTAYTGRAKALAQKYAGLLGRTRWDLVDAFKDGWDLYSAASSHGGVATAAGIRLGAGAAQKSGFVQYSFERMDLLAHTDVILTTSASLPFLRKQAVFTRLPAARGGRVYATDLFFPASYGIARGLLDDLSTVCAKASNA